MAWHEKCHTIVFEVCKLLLYLMCGFSTKEYTGYGDYMSVWG